MKVHIFGLALLLFLFPNVCQSMPAQVFIIRHAEKPQDLSDPHLSPEGRKRAEALVDLFTNKNSAFNEFGPPAAIYAASPKKEGSSLRSIETARPLATKLSLALIDKFNPGDEKKLVEEIKRDPTYSGKSVLIVWVHDKISEVAKKMGVASPPKWQSDVYDCLWRIKFINGQSPKLEQIFQPSDLNGKDE